MTKVSVNKVLVSSKKFLRQVYNVLEGQTPLINFSYDLRKEVDNELVSLLNDLVIPVMQENLDINKSRFTDTLYGGIEFVAVEPGRVVLDAKEANDYIQFIEKGSKPRYIDSEEAANILQWVMFKDIPGDPVSNAEHVIEKLTNEGNTPHPFIEPAMDKMIETVKDTMDNKMRELIGD